jgi:hypothetical protein
MSNEQHSPKAHTALLHKLESVVPHIVPRGPELPSPRLWHPDLHAENIYIDDQARNSSIIDWQGEWTAPVFIGAKPPLLLDYGVDILIQLPEDFKKLDEVMEKKLGY